MSPQDEHIRTVKDAGAEAMALFRKIEMERSANPIPRPDLRERFAARLIDFVSYVLVILVVLNFRALVTAIRGGGDKEEPEPRPCLMDASIDCYPLPPWGPVAIEWRLAALLLIIAVGVVAWEVIQTRLFGATIGKRWYALIVVNAKATGTASAKKIAIRAAVMAAPVVVMVGLWSESLTYGLAGAAMAATVSVTILRGDHRGGLHDRLAETEVITRDVRGLAIEKVRDRMTPGGTESG